MDNTSTVYVVLEERTSCDANWEPIAGQTFTRAIKVFDDFEQADSWIEFNPRINITLLSTMKSPKAIVTRESPKNDDDCEARYRYYLSYDNDDGSHVDQYYKIRYYINHATCGFYN